jgi:uncharacterized protein YgbK (DUF1537 family)
MHEVLFETLLENLPPEPESVLDEIKKQVSDSNRKVVVLDDDPTGTQTVHGISVLTEWSIPVLQAELMLDSPAFFILTNSRSLPRKVAQALNHQIGVNLKTAAQQAGQPFVVISRSDSTLRGNYPCETDALAEGLGTHFDGIMIAPYFREGGRYTINDIHYVVNQGKAFPVSETEFARDPAFSYSESNLPLWVQEKTKGEIQADEVVSLSIEEIRFGDILPKLIGLKDEQVCIVNAACDADLEQVVLRLLEAEDKGKRFLYRTAASFVRVRAGISLRSLLTSSELDTGKRSGGLIVVGSFVPKTNLQMEVLRRKYKFIEIELDVDTLLKDWRRQSVLSDVRQKINQAISAGMDVLLYTSRELVTGTNRRHTLEIGEMVSDSLVSCVKGLRTCPRYLVAKGGITSSDVATKGLNVRKALVLGQVLPGVPVWQLGEESRYPGMVYVVFPGNVGDKNALADVISMFPPEWENSIWSRRN